MCKAFMCLGSDHVSWVGYSALPAEKTQEEYKGNRETCGCSATCHMGAIPRAKEGVKSQMSTELPHGP
ncbi:hypothetical protein KI387_038353, partial [Taxus chinensis]